MLNEVACDMLSSVRELYIPGTCFKKRDFATLICGGVFFCAVIKLVQVIMGG